MAGRNGSRGLSLFALALVVLSASPAASQVVWKYDAFAYGWAYLSGERPNLNVPYPVLLAEPTLQGNNACGTTATFTNLSCVSPPEVVNVSWFIQSIDAIQDVDQIFTLNMVLNVQWRDWRLAYAEGGFGCWATSVQLGAMSSAAASTLAASLLTAILALWNCPSATSCTGSSLPPGVLPTVSVTAAGLVTVFPAPLDWQRVCSTIAMNPAPPLLSNPLLASLTGSPCTSGVTSTQYKTALTNAGGVWLPTSMWLPVAVPCVGAGARKLPPALTLSSTQAQGTPPSGYGGPGGGPAGVPGGTSGFPMGTSLDYNTIWDPAMEDSMNQEAPDTVLNEEWTLDPNGVVLHQLHFQADYAMTGLHLDNFPFDKPMIVATRRPFGVNMDELLFNPVDWGFALPQEMDGWRVLDTGLATCYTYDVGVGDPDVMPTNCGQPDALGPCRSTAVLWIRLNRAPAYWLQNMLAPITLITILAGATYFNDLDSYDSRMTVMATSLLSLMALSGYVSSMLPPTEVITFIHYALYTSYALMGWGIGVVIVVSFMLSADLEHAKKVCPPVNPADADDGIPVRPQWRHFLHGRLRFRILRVHTLQEGEVQVKPWVMRLYYHDALIFRRLLDGTANEADCVQALVYFKAEALQAARLAELRGEGVVTGMPRIPSDDGQPEPAPRASTELEAPPVPASPAKPAAADEEDPAGPPYCPSMIRLRLLVIELDCAMRVLHLLIYGLVLLGRYVQIKDDGAGDFDCNDLITYFANA